LPEIADYEVRRELLRARQVGSVRRLDALAGRIEYLPITTTAMRMAADFWSAMRQAGLPTAGERAIDADCILAGHAASLGLSDIIVATTNVRHIARFVPAATWESIT
jgi:predicted nucleic acid-binding protein